MPITAGSSPTTAFRSRTISTRTTWSSGRCACSTKIACTGAGLRHPRASQHGDHQLRARRRAHAPGLHRHGSTIRPGDVQRMSAGSGVRHSEFNGVADQQAAFSADLDSAERGRHSAELRREALRGRRQTRPVAVDRVIEWRGGLGARAPGCARVRRALRRARSSASLTLAPGRRAYVHVARGSVHANGVELNAGDALKLTGRAASSKSRKAPRPKSWCSICLVRGSSPAERAWLSACAFRRRAAACAHSRRRLATRCQREFMRRLHRLTEPRHDEPRAGFRRELQQRFDGFVPGMQREIEGAPVHGQQRPAA